MRAWGAASHPLTLALAPTTAGPASQAQNARILAAYLERCLERQVRVVAETSYAATVAAMRAGRVDAAMLGELATIQGQSDGIVEPLVVLADADGRVPTYRSAIVSHIESGLHTLPALRGATIGLVDEHSTSGFLAPRVMLREAGLDPDRDVSTRLLGSHLAVAEAVIAGTVVAGALHIRYLEPPSLDRGPDYARLRVLASSRPIPRGPLVVRAELPDDVRRQLADALIHVHEADPAAAGVLAAAAHRTGARFTLASRRSIATLKSIAALAGVSHMTVSRVVNRSGYVAPATAARIEAIVNELRFRPNGNVNSARGRLAPLVGFIVPREPDRDVNTLADRLQGDLARARVPLVRCVVDGRLDESLFLDLLLDGRLGALVITERYATDPAVAEAARAGRVVVALGVDAASPGVLVASQATAIDTVLAALGLSSLSESTGSTSVAQQQSV